MKNCLVCAGLTTNELGSCAGKTYYLCKICERNLQPTTIYKLKKYIKDREIEWLLEQAQMIKRELT